jgi:Galactose oxidase, central domain
MRASFFLPLLLLGVAGDGPIALAQSPGTFTATGGARTPRAGHSATILTNGKVLIAGGLVGFDAQTATAELYDPNSGIFTPTGDMRTPRAFHTGTLLPDGTVLIAGGRIGVGQAIPTNRAEIYDPSTGTFAATGNMISDHECQQANLLGNGKVLIAGGSGPDDRVPYAELYDPATGIFAATGTYVTDTHLYGYNTCQGSESALLPDGRVLIVLEEGGAEIYNPYDGAFTRTGNTTYASYSDGLPTATLLMNGKVLLAGGADDSGIHTGAEQYEPPSGTFTRTGDMTAPRGGDSATLLPDGNVLMAGAYVFGGATRASAELYDPVKGVFTPTADMTTPRCCHTATLLKDGRVLIVGAGIPTSLAELYNPSVLVPAPVLLSLSGDGRGQGAILHAGTAQAVTTDNPTFPGETLEIYVTGLKDGSVISPQVAIGGRLAEILYFGKAPGFAGLNQVNVRVPSGVATGLPSPCD